MVAFQANTIPWAGCANANWCCTCCWNLPVGRRFNTDYQRDTNPSICGKPPLAGQDPGLSCLGGVVDIRAAPYRFGMQLVALAILIATSLWFFAVAVLMALRPSVCIHLLSRAAANHRVNLGEQGLRFLAGAALVVRAPFSRAPLLFEAGGWFIVATSVALMLLPLKWHSGYAKWWAQQLTHARVRALSPLSFAAGLALLYALFPAA